MAEFRSPANDGEVLAVPDFAAVAALVEENGRKLDRDDVTIGGLPLRELRAMARREVLELANGRREPASAASVHQPAHAGRSPDAPLLITGHQPELSHPGVWVKNFALNGLAKKLGGIPLHLVVDNDTLKSTSLRFPVLRDRDPRSVRLESLAFDTMTGAEPYETRRVEDAEHVCVFDSFADRSRPLWANWGYEPLLWEAWHPIVHHCGPGALIGERFAGVRQEYEREWGCRNLELPVSRLSQTEAFARFAAHILGDLPRFREVYNVAIRAYRDANGIRSDNHPAPELAEGEAPFWVRTATGRRERAKPTSDVRNIRPRALTLTLFARVCLGDFFIHGIGGGKYDEVTDDIIRRYFGIEAPAYQVLSATLHLPLPGFPSTSDDLKRAERRVRDLHWNPQRHLSPENLARPEVRTLIERKAALAAAEPPRTDHAARREWFRSLQKVTEELRPFVAGQEPEAERELARVRAEVAANEVLRRRDYAWVLYPEETLRPFLQRFLKM
jgi:hypothetical protein